MLLILKVLESDGILANHNVSDKHPGEDFSQAAMIAGDVAKDQPANADIGLKLPMVSAKFHDGSRLLSHRTRRACPTVPCGKR